MPDTLMMSSFVYAYDSVALAARTTAKSRMSRSLASDARYRRRTMTAATAMSAVVTSELRKLSASPAVNRSLSQAPVVTNTPLCGSDASTDSADDTTL